MRALLSHLLLRNAAVATLVAVNAIAAQPEIRQFKDRGLKSFEIIAPDITAQSIPATPKAWAKGKAPGYGNVEFSADVVLEIAGGASAEAVLNRTRLKVKEQISDTLFILESANVSDALDESEALAEVPEIVTARPMLRRKPSALAAYGPPAKDTLFPSQWHLENRDAQGHRAGVDLNIRGAWAHTRGAGVILAVVDDGVDLQHPDLSGRATSMPHFNFLTGLASGLPSALDSHHGTAVAGLALASADNDLGVAGVAPHAQLASWIVLGNFGLTEDALRKMYENRLDIIDVQNHSWGWITDEQVPLSALEETGIQRAFTQGRAGRGIVNVRAGGNDRAFGQNVNDEQAANDPRVIAVAAVRKDGRVTSYSEPGACVLVAAPSGDTTREFANLVTTDRRGPVGYNTNSLAAANPDYTVGADGFSGTSASSPEIAGVAALVLSANSKLSVRDVQQILALSARHFDLKDPRLQTNGAGLLVSDNVGYGVPDAGEAVRIAKTWPLKPAATNLTFTSTVTKAIGTVPGVEFAATNLSPVYRYVQSLPSLGYEPRDPTRALPLVHLGKVTEPVTLDLRGKGALIQRGVSYFYEKIDWAAAAGAEFAIIYDNEGTTNTMLMGLTDFASIPAAFIGRSDGEHIQKLLAGRTNVTARINAGDESRAATYSFPVNETLICEHVGVNIQSDHPRRGDLRIVVVSPSGTESVLQRRNLDATSGPQDYTYYSVQQFFEPTAGEWKVHVYDEEEGQSGSVRQVKLSLRGVSISDRDRDGLDDAWETRSFANLQQNQLGDPDGDGYNNAREQALGTSPVIANSQLRLDWTALDATRNRISWPAIQGKEYRVLTADRSGEVSVLTNIIGRFPEAEIIIEPNSGIKLFRIEQRN